MWPRESLTLWVPVSPCTKWRGYPSREVAVNTESRPHTHTDTHTQTQTHIHTHRHRHTDTDTHRHRHTQTHTHTDTHTHGLAWWTSLVTQSVKNLPPMREIWVRLLGQEDPLEKEMATHSSILAWIIPCTEEPGGLQSMRSQESDTTKRLKPTKLPPVWCLECSKDS